MLEGPTNTHTKRVIQSTSTFVLLQELLGADWYSLHMVPTGHRLLLPESLSAQYPGGYWLQSQHCPACCQMHEDAQLPSLQSAGELLYCWPYLTSMPCNQAPVAAGSLSPRYMNSDS